MTEHVTNNVPERNEGRKSWNPIDKRGLECRYCGCKHFRVIYTRPASGGRIARRREYRNCEKRMTTWEKPANG
jgi:hypothetical protein